MMKTTIHGNDLIQLTNFFPANSYLVREADGFTLIDTGIGGGAAKILAAAQQYGAAIRRIALTHAHVDHVGSLDALREQLPNIEIAVPEREARFLRGDMTLDAGEPSPLRGGWQVCKTTPTRLLNAGDRVGSLEVIASPGHSPGHIAFFDHRDGTLIAGDAYSTQAGISTAGMLRILFPFTAMATWHKPTALRSAEALVQWKPTRLATGHGDVLTDPVPAMQSAIAEAKHHLERTAHVGQKTY
jgi:glyoxylase-like metal-dependent hydrolase (beta-lactamase superfamily II)